MFPEREIKLSPVNTGTDYVLPDYMGDIRKMLNQSVRILPSGRFVSESEATFVGVVCYTVVYLDNENKLTEASFTSDYEYGIKIGEEFIDADSSCTISGISIRPSAPRKLSARATLCPIVSITEDKAPPSPEIKDCIQILPSAVRESSLEILRVGEREYAEEGARLQGVQAEEVQVLHCGGDAIITETAFRAGEIIINGALELYALLMIDGATPLRIEKSIPITASAAYESEKDCEMITEVIMPSLRVTVNDTVTENGDGGSSDEPITSVVFNATVDYTVKAYGNRETSVALDAFSTEGDCECKYREYGYSEFLGVVHEEIPLSFEIDRRELEMNEIGDILSQEGRFNLILCEPEDGAVKMEGDLMLALLMQVPDEMGYVLQKSTQRIEHTFKIPYTSSGNLKINPKASVCGLQVTVDNSKLYVKCKIVCEMSVKESRKMHIVEEMTTNVSENQEKHCGIVTVYYPDKNDTLWEIAKKYRKSMASIAEENMLSSDCLADGGTVKLEDIERIIITKNI